MLESSYQKLYRNSEQIIKQHSKMLSDQQTNFMDDITKWSIKTNEFQNEIKAYDVSLHSAEEAYSHMIRQYMIQNVQYRPSNCPAPDRFKEASDEKKILFKYAIDNYAREVFKQHFDVYLDDDKRGKLTKEYTAAVKNEFQVFNKKITDYAEKTGKDIKEQNDELEKIF